MTRHTLISTALWMASIQSISASASDHLWREVVADRSDAATPAPAVRLLDRADWAREDSLWREQVAVATLGTARYVRVSGERGQAHEDSLWREQIPLAADGEREGEPSRGPRLGLQNRDGHGE